MKKITITIISLAMIFIFASTATSLINANTTSFPKAAATTIKYIVNVNLAQEQAICGSYIVMLTDGDGNMIAPAQPYIQGVYSYVFYEIGHDFVGNRVARMEISESMDDPVCDQPLVTPPIERFTFYKTGQTYLFNLYPTMEQQHE